MEWKWLHIEYPFEKTNKEKGNVILFISLFGALLVLFLQPYGFSPLDQLLTFLTTIFIAIVTLGINYFAFPYFFPDIFKETTWSVSKAFLFFLYNFIIIGLWNHIIHVFLTKENIFFMYSSSEVIAMLLRTIAIGIFSAFFLVLLKYNFLTRKHLQISQTLNKELKARYRNNENDEYKEDIEIPLEKNSLSFKRELLKFVKAEGNYIALYFVNSEKTTPKLYRLPIKEIDSCLGEFPEFFRCHRSFIINLNSIEFYTGNSQGLYIKMIDENIRIPVSRSKIKLLKQHLDKIKK